MLRGLRRGQGFGDHADSVGDVTGGGPPRLGGRRTGCGRAGEGFTRLEGSETAISVLGDCSNRLLPVSSSLTEALARIRAAEEEAKQLLSRAELEAKERLGNAEVRARGVYDETYNARLSQARASAAQAQQAREAAKEEAEGIYKEAEKQVAALRSQAERKLQMVVKALADEILSVAGGKQGD